MTRHVYLSIFSLFVLLFGNDCSIEESIRNRVIKLLYKWQSDKYVLKEILAVATELIKTNAIDLVCMIPRLVEIGTREWEQRDCWCDRANNTRHAVILTAVLHFLGELCLATSDLGAVHESALVSFCSRLFIEAKEYVTIIWDTSCILVRLRESPCPVSVVSSLAEELELQLEHPQILEHILQLLQWLCEHKDGAELLIREGILDSLLRLVKKQEADDKATMTTDVLTMGRIIRIIHNMIDHHEASLLAHIVNSEILASVVRYLPRAFPFPYRADPMLVVAKVAVDATTDQVQALLKMGVVPPLLQIFQLSVSATHASATVTTSTTAAAATTTTTTTVATMTARDDEERKISATLAALHTLMGKFPMALTEHEVDVLVPQLTSFIMMLPWGPSETNIMINATSLLTRCVGPNE